MNYLYLSISSTFLVTLIFFILYKLSKISNDQIFSIFFLILLFVCPISNFLFLINLDLFTEGSGWRNVNSFNFNFINISILYIDLFINLFIFIIIYYILSQILSFSKKSNYIITIYRQKEIIFTNYYYYYFLLLIFSCIFSIFLYKFNIGITGIPSEKLPFKLSGFLIYLRLFIFPLILFYLSLFINNSLFFSIVTLLCAIFLGVTSGSKAITLIYLTPLIYLYIQSNKISIIKVFILIIAFQIPEFSRNHSFQTNDRFLLELVNSVGYEIYQYFNNDFISNFLMSLLGFFTRIYSLQSLILGSEYELLNPLQSVFNYLFIDYLIDNPALELFNLNFQEGYNFGVNIGLLGNLMIISKSGIIYLIIFLLYVSFQFIFFRFIISFFHFTQPVSFFLILVYLIKTIEGMVVFINYYLIILFIIVMIFKLFKKDS